MTNALRLTTALTEALPSDVRIAIAEIGVAAFNNERFGELFHLIPDGIQHFLGWEGDQVVSHAMLSTRWLQPEGLPLLRTAYVDAVVTRPDRQGMGYGSAVMRQVAEAAIAADFTVAGLETTRPGFYERLGWQLWRGPLAGRSEAGLVPTPDQTGIMVLRLPKTPPLDLDRGLTIECQPTRIW